ncbi:MAG: bifunctional glutamate N-acetyltransferase/amino-acid acetyltransferase ArgJ [Gammaproteobacteria bacterium]|nr:bifunctional glutamate N-acetyltransferase/amino-acid acetyltransferase ArgJ [Gammaproteobacteria bacterium]
MAVNLPEMGELLPVAGIQLGCSSAGIRYQGRNDLAVIRLDPGSVVGGVFTRSSFRAPPVAVAAANCGLARGLVINSGNANAATGETGLRDAHASCEMLATHIACDAQEILPFSTGVIGEFLPMDRVAQGIDAAASRLNDHGWADAARAIMTTDTAPKAVSGRFEVMQRTVTATAMVKGSGMIRPDMATLLAFLGMDAAVSPETCARLVRDLADRSFNRLTIDGDTSTNDSFVVMATGQAGGDAIEAGSNGYDALLDGLTPLVVELAQRTVRDGEGATKFVTIDVVDGRDSDECLQVAYTVAHSPLVKTAIFAGDPNWGRFCMAIGRAGIDGLDPCGISLYLDDVTVAEGGLVAGSYSEDDAVRVMARDEYVITIRLGRGAASETIWTSDLSYEYVRINAEYRT